MKDDAGSLQSLGKGICIFHLVGTVCGILIIRFLNFGFDCQNSGLKCHFFDLIFVHHFNKFIISDLATLVTHLVCHKAETNQSNQKTDHKSQNGLMIFVWSLVFRIIPVSVRSVIHMIVHYFPPLLVFFIIKRFTT